MGSQARSGPKWGTTRADLIARGNPRLLVRSGFDARREAKPPRAEPVSLGTRVRAHQAPLHGLGVGASSRTARPGERDWESMSLADPHESLPRSAKGTY